jgi:hypothetical protein
MRDNKKRVNVVVITLIAVIVVLLLVISYTFAVRPAITGFVTNAQGEGYQIAIIQIAQLAVDGGCKPIPLVIGEQTIEVIAVGCLPPEIVNQLPR